MKDVECLLWDIFSPRDLTYFCLPFYHHFSARSYHARTVRQDWDAKRLREDLAAYLIRSEIQVDPDRPANQEQIERLLFRLSDDVFCHLEDSDLTVYAPTWAQAVELAEKLARKYAKPKPADQPCFYLLSAGPGNIEAERVKLSRPSLLSESDLSLNYGPGAVEFEQKMIEALREQTGGASVFRGEPGTGKTSFIRHLAS